MNKEILNSLDSYLEKERTLEAMKVFKDYLCTKEDIFITPSTFIYKNYKDNLLWYGEEDKDLFDKIMLVKRIKSQIYHDNSEDALTWNVFRLLEKYKLLSGYLKQLTNTPIKNANIIYWSYSQMQQNAWRELINARIEFGEANDTKAAIKKGSEPDIIVKSDNVLFFIEVKLQANNNTICKSNNPKVQEKYKTGGKRWFMKVFKSDFKKIAVVQKKYELLRFWLIGTWIANQLNLDFYLVNIVRSEQEKNIEAIFKEYIRFNKHQTFLRISWEDIYDYISNVDSLRRDKEIITKYFMNKTIGYQNGKLKKAFSIH